MKFRPCIDIHNGAVKQIIGSSLRDSGDQAVENFVAQKSGAEFAAMFRKDGLNGGHIILLNKKDSPHFEATRAQALGALRAFPGGMQIGGGITDENAEHYIEEGASHVIVTSFVFRNGEIVGEHLERLVQAVGREHVVLDLSCRYYPEEGCYYIMTDRWQKRTETPLTKNLMEYLKSYCDEFLVHAVDVEGRGQGVDERLVRILSEEADFPVTYAGGIRGTEDIALLDRIGDGRIDFTVGSALDIYGGHLSYAKLARNFGRR